MIKFTPIDRSPPEANLITPSTRDVVIDVKTTVVSFPEEVFPTFTIDAVTIGANLNSGNVELNAFSEAAVTVALL